MPASSITLGHDKTNWETSTQTQFKQTVGVVRDVPMDKYRAAVNPDTKSVHWSLGDTSTEYYTSNTLPDPRLTGHKPAQLEKEQESQLRASHFTLGFDKPDYSRNRMPSNEDLCEASLRQQRMNKSLWGSKPAGKKNIHFGHDSSEYRSESCTNFVDHGFDNNEEDKERTRQFVEKLKQSAVVFGFNQNEYSTTNKLEDYRNAPRTKPQVGSNKSSLVLGFHKRTYETENKKSFKPM